MSEAKQTRNHAEIRRWVEERGGVPAIVKGTGGLLRIAFAGGADNDEEEEELEEVSWERWFAIFDDRGLVFLHQPEGESRFTKLISEDTAEERSGS